MILRERLSIAAEKSGSRGGESAGGSERDLLREVTKNRGEGKKKIKE